MMSEWSFSKHRSIAKTNRKVGIGLESSRGIRAGNRSGPGWVRRAVAISLFDLKVSLLCRCTLEGNDCGGNGRCWDVRDNIDGCLDQDRWSEILGDCIEVDQLRGRVSNARKSGYT